MNWSSVAPIFAHRANIGKQIASRALPHRHIQFKNQPMNIGLVIRTLRAERGLTQEQLALAAEVATSNISRIEGGKRNPSVDLLKRIAAALGMSPSDIYAAIEGRDLPSNSILSLKDASPEDYTPEAMSWLRHFRELTPDNQHMAVEYIKLLGRMQRQREATKTKG